MVQAFQSDTSELGRPFLIWRGEQRAIGELMIEPDTAPARCIGYAQFLERDDPAFRRWFARLEGDVDQLASGPNRRLLELQHALVGLIRELDPAGMRYSDEVLAKV